MKIKKKVKEKADFMSNKNNGLAEMQYFSLNFLILHVVFKSHVH